MYSLFLVSTVLPRPMICHSSCLLGTYREFALVFFDVQSVFYSLPCNTINTDNRLVGIQGGALFPPGVDGYLQNRQNAQ